MIQVPATRETAHHKAEKVEHLCDSNLIQYFKEAKEIRTYSLLQLFRLDKENCTTSLSCG